MTIFILVLSYLIGSIPFALVIGKGIYKVDIREHGSGNLGGTNAMRTLGKKPGSFVMLGDALKGTLAASLPLIFGSDLHPIWAAVPAILGHCYPIFAGFRGGKAVATTAGTILFLLPFGFLIGIISFLISLKISKYVSLSSVIAGIVILFYSFTVDIYTQIFTLLITLFIIYKHRENFKRIKSKTEPKVTWI